MSSEGTTFRRLLSALDRPALLRIGRTYHLNGDHSELPTEQLLALLGETSGADVAEVVQVVLRREELALAAERLGLPTGGTREQLARRLAKHLRWRAFEVARAWAQSQGLSGHLDWERLRKRGGIPPDIPAFPDGKYRGSGWISWGDWLGTGNLGPRDYHYRPFQEARAFARSLRLASSTEWVAWCRGERPDLPARPPDVPTNPWRAYKGEWQGYGDWLGTGSVSTMARHVAFRDFVLARAFARSLGLRSAPEWTAWCRGDRRGLPAKPDDLPTHPQRTYREQWVSWADWLGTGRPPRGTFRPFQEARAFVRELGLRGEGEWRLWCQGHLPSKPSRPPDIPTNPQRTYAGQGWVSWGDWFGTGHVSTNKRAFLSFEEARRFARSLRLPSPLAWREWCRGEHPDKPPRPETVPTNPWRSYAAEWQGWGDFLDTPVEKRRSARRKA